MAEPWFTQDEDLSVVVRYDHIQADFERLMQVLTRIADALEHDWDEAVESARATLAEAKGDTPAGA
jgi:hypothetical protein